MTQDMQAVRDDLAFMKALAQEGRRAPLLNGRFLLAAGLIYGGTSLVAWLIVIRIVAVPYGWLAPLWIGVTIVFVVCVRVTRGCMSAKPGTTAVTNRAVAAVWQGLGYAMLAMLCAALIIAHELKTSAIFAVFPSLVLAIYGMAWWLAATMSDVKWIRWTSLACFLAAVLIGLLIRSSALYLAFTAALLLLIALPGWLLLRAEPSDIV